MLHFFLSFEARLSEHLLETSKPIYLKKGRKNAVTHELLKFTHACTHTLTCPKVGESPPPNLILATL
jgi:hypothetical protein